MCSYYEVLVFLIIYIIVDINHKSYEIVFYVFIRNGPRRFRRGLFLGPKGAK